MYIQFREIVSGILFPSPKNWPKTRTEINVLIPFLVSIPTPAQIIRRDLSEIWERKKLTTKSTHIPLPCLPQKKKIKAISCLSVITYVVNNRHRPLKEKCLPRSILILALTHFRFFPSLGKANAFVDQLET